jgi:hypothetical protein
MSPLTVRVGRLVPENEYADVRAENVRLFKDMLLDPNRTAVDDPSLNTTFSVPLMKPGMAPPCQLADAVIVPSSPLPTQK